MVSITENLSNLVSLISDDKTHPLAAAVSLLGLLLTLLSLQIGKKLFSLHIVPDWEQMI